MIFIKNKKLLKQIIFIGIPLLTALISLPGFPSNIASAITFLIPSYCFLAILIIDSTCREDKIANDIWKKIKQKEYQSNFKYKYNDGRNIHNFMIVSSENNSLSKTDAIKKILEEVNSYSREFNLLELQIRDYEWDILFKRIYELLCEKQNESSFYDLTIDFCRKSFDKERKKRNPIIDIFTFISNLKLDGIGSEEIRTVRKKILLDIKQTVDRVPKNIINIEGNDLKEPIVNIENIPFNSDSIIYLKKYKRNKTY